MASVLVLDNYDSFTFNLVQYLGELGAEPGGGAQRRRRRVDELLRPRRRSGWWSRPGRARPPRRASRCEAIRRFAEAGHAGARACAWATRRWPRPSAGKVVRGEPVHGKTAAVEHDGRTDLPRLDVAVRGRSLSLAGRGPRPAATSSRSPRAPGDVIMGLRHRELPAEGVQFHPESVLTGRARQLLRNFLRCAEADRSSPRPSTGSADGQDLSADEAAAVLREIMEGRASEVQTAAFLIALRAQGGDRRRGGGPGPHHARAGGARGAWTATSWTPRAPGGGRLDLQRLDHRGLRGRGRGLPGGQARRPLEHRPVRLGRRAGGAGRPHRPGPRGGGRLRRGGRLRLHVRARPPRAR